MKTPVETHRTAATENIESEAWLLVGITRSLAGWMVLEDEYVAFADEEGHVHFSTPLAEIERVWSPWYYFGGGLKIRIDGIAFRITFTRPNDQPGGVRRPLRFGSDPCGISTAAFAWSKFNDIFRGREWTRRWKTALPVEQC